MTDKSRGRLHYTSKYGTLNCPLPGCPAGELHAARHLCNSCGKNCVNDLNTQTCPDCGTYVICSNCYIPSLKGLWACKTCTLHKSIELRKHLYSPSPDITHLVSVAVQGTEFSVLIPGPVNGERIIFYPFFKLISKFGSCRTILHDQARLEILVTGLNNITFKNKNITATYKHKITIWLKKWFGPYDILFPNNTNEDDDKKLWDSWDNVFKHLQQYVQPSICRIRQVLQILEQPWAYSRVSFILYFLQFQYFSIFSHLLHWLLLIHQNTNLSWWRNLFQNGCILIIPDYLH